MLIDFKKLGLSTIAGKTFLVKLNGLLREKTKEKEEAASLQPTLAALMCQQTEPKTKLLEPQT